MQIGNIFFIRCDMKSFDMILS